MATARAIDGLDDGLLRFSSLDERGRRFVRDNYDPPTTVSATELKALLLSWILRRNRPTVFLSHSSADKAFARQLAASLNSHNISVWLDEAELRVGDSLVERISQSVQSVDFVLAVLSPASTESRWVQHELELAMSAQIHAGRIKVLPVLRAPCRLPAFLEGRLYSDFTDDAKYDEALALVVRSIAEHLLDSL